MNNNLDDFLTQIQCDEFVDPAEDFDWNEYYTDEEKASLEVEDRDPGFVDVDWLYEERTDIGDMY